MSAVVMKRMDFCCISSFDVLPLIFLTSRVPAGPKDHNGQVAELFRDLTAFPQSAGPPFLIVKGEPLVDLYRQVAANSGLKQSASDASPALSRRVAAAIQHACVLL